MSSLPKLVVINLVVVTIGALQFSVLLLPINEPRLLFHWQQDHQHYPDRHCVAELYMKKVQRRVG